MNSKPIASCPKKKDCCPEKATSFFRISIFSRQVRLTIDCCQDLCTLELYAIVALYIIASTFSKSSFVDSGSLQHVPPVFFSVPLLYFRLSFSILFMSANKNVLKMNPKRPKIIIDISRIPADFVRFFIHVYLWLTYTRE